MPGSGTPRKPCKRGKQSFVPTGMRVISTANGRSLENSYLVRLPVLYRYSIPHLTMMIEWFNHSRRTVTNPKTRHSDEPAECGLVRHPVHLYISPQGRDRGLDLRRIQERDPMPPYHPPIKGRWRWTGTWALSFIYKKYSVTQFVQGDSAALSRPNAGRDLPSVETSGQLRILRRSDGTNQGPHLAGLFRQNSSV